jgi:LmbE family N-acetylglucosaminyl deacetylase
MRLSAIVLFLIPTFCLAQGHKQPDAARIRLEIKKLGVLGSVLYLAAHPDDENTRVITYMVNERLMTTAYLSLTRGDGGQNLIGPEFRDLLGLIRTQELMSARRIDGGNQFFTRAIDFGFSKNAAETFTIWHRDSLLSDVVRIIREFQPDIILTRFPPDQRAGHGQHTVSAMLAQEAFNKSNDPAVFPDQVATWGTWQVKRLLTNTSRFWNQTINEKTPGIAILDAGAYNTLLGTSYSELAAESRSQHKSQGFGVSGRRGESLEFFELAKGDSAGKDVLSGINTSWSRIKGGEKIQPLVDKVLAGFKDENPSASVPELIQIRKAITQLEPSRWRERKTAEADKIIQHCLGLFAEVTSDHYWVSPGEPVIASFEILNRSNAAVSLTRIECSDLSLDSVMNDSLNNNIPLAFKSRKSIRKDKNYSGPYWLNEPHGEGLFTVSDHRLIGKPENDPAIVVNATFMVCGQPLTIACPVIYKWTDPVKGESIRPCEVVPPISLQLGSKVFVFPDVQPHEVPVMLKAVTDHALHGTVTLNVPLGWKSMPESIPFDLSARGQELTLSFSVIPSTEEVNGLIKAVATVDGRRFDQSVIEIAYDHIPTQTVLPKASAKALRLNLKKEGALIGYIRGAGDDIPAGLKNMGYQVWELKDEEITPENLKKLDAVVLGVRALNTNDRVRHFMPDLLNYVKNGGTMISQYNNNQGLEIDADKIAPYPLSLSRDRVTEENAEVSILKPDHPALNFPNKITAGDFEGWVQERGLYFPDKWDARYEALLSFHDAGEPAKDGGLLVANYGSGYYVYTGLSFFRELPEGVPGAYRLFANLTSLGKSKKPGNVKIKTKLK